MFRFFFDLLYMVFMFLFIYSVLNRNINYCFLIAELKTKWLDSSAEELKNDEVYMMELFDALVSSVGKNAYWTTYKNNIHALEFTVMAHSDKVFLRDLSDDYIDERKAFFEKLCARKGLWVLDD